MSKRQGEEDEGGLSSSSLVETAWRAFQAARQGLSSPVPEWGDLEEDYQGAFAAAVAKARDTAVAAADTDGFSAQSAACDSLIAFQTAIGSEPAPDPRAQIAFEAVVRHVVNAMCWDEEDHGELSDHESAWSEWSARKHQSLQGV